MSQTPFFLRFIASIGKLAPYIFALVLAAGATGMYFKQNVVEPVDKKSGKIERFIVKSGTNWKSISKELEEKGLLKKWWSLYMTVRLRESFSEKGVPKLTTGEYKLAKSYSPLRILRAIEGGEQVVYSVTIPEGTTAKEIPAILAETKLVTVEEVEKAIVDPATPSIMGVESKTLEGYLFPDTYHFTRPIDAQGVIKKLVKTAVNKKTPDRINKALSLGMSYREIINLASIIEKETGDASERELISATFHNRLRIGMRLQSDPTVIYGIQDFDGNLKKSHLKDETNPYNSYKHTGLPPTPICNPGEAAIDAALNPADVGYLYFVAKGDGTHQFSNSYKQHYAAVVKYQKKRKKKS